MADVDLISITFQDGDGPVDRLAVEYSNTNMRLQRAYVNIQTTRVVRILVWDTLNGGNPQNDATALYDFTFVGPTVSETPIAGNHRMREVTDEVGTYHDFPEGWVHEIREHMA